MKKYMLGDEIMTTSEQLNNMSAIIQAQEEIARYNDELDRYITGALTNIYASAGIKITGGSISGNDVIRASSLYNKYVRQRFGLRAADIITDMHARGYDVRMDMSTYKLVWKGVYNNA